MDKKSEKKGAHIKAAARFVLDAQQAMKMDTQYFRDYLESVLNRSGTETQRHYFVKHKHVFRDWLKGARPMPVWAQMAIIELMFTALSQPDVHESNRAYLRAKIREVVEDIAGGAEILEWINATQSRLTKFSESHEA